MLSIDEYLDFAEKYPVLAEALERAEAQAKLARAKGVSDTGSLAAIMALYALQIVAFDLNRRVETLERTCEPD